MTSGKQMALSRSCSEISTHSTVGSTIGSGFAGTSDLELSGTNSFSVPTTAQPGNQPSLTHGLVLSTSGAVGLGQTIASATNLAQAWQQQKDQEPVRPILSNERLDHLGASGYWALVSVWAIVSPSQCSDRSEG